MKFVLLYKNLIKRYIKKEIVILLNVKNNLINILQKNHNIDILSKDDFYVKTKVNINNQIKIMYLQLIQLNKKEKHLKSVILMLN